MTILCGQMVDRISQFDDGKIETIVNRIPAEYLPPAKKTLIVANLKSRKQRLHTLFGLQVSDGDLATPDRVN